MRRKLATVWNEDIAPATPTVALAAMCASLLLGQWSTAALHAAAYLLWLLASSKGVYDLHDRDRATLLLRRYYLFRTPWLRVFLHKMHAHDAGRYPHNHPWMWSRARILRGGYLEYRIGGGLDRRVLSSSGNGSYRWYAAGDWNVLRLEDYHRIEHLQENTWTLFVAGPKNLDWGFLTPNGHVNARGPGSEP